MDDETCMECGDDIEGWPRFSLQDQSLGEVYFCSAECFHTNKAVRTALDQGDWGKVYELREQLKQFKAKKR